MDLLGHGHILKMIIAHVEQKNWSHVRRLLGYDRLCNIELCAIINDIYENIWGPLNSFFLPNTKLVKKERDGAKSISNMINQKHRMSGYKTVVI